MTLGLWLAAAGVLWLLAGTGIALIVGPILRAVNRSRP